MPIVIDAHVHITPPDIIKNWQKIAAYEPHFSLLSSGKANGFADANEIISYMNKCEINKSVIFGFAFKDAGLCRECNDYVIDCVTEFPDKFIGAMIINPTSSEALPEISRCFNAGLCMIGELSPDGQNWDIENLSQTSEICEAAASLNIPVMIHGNEDVGHYYPGKTSTNPHKLERLALNHSDVNFIFAHWGGGLALFELMKSIKGKLKNVYYDTAATHFLYHDSIYSVAANIGILDKLLFGSDFPLRSSESIISDIRRNLLSDAQSHVLGDTISKLLNL